VSVETGRNTMRGRTYIIDAPVSVPQPLPLAAVADEAVGPDPLDVLHGAARLRVHDVAQAGVVGRGGAIGDGEVAARDVTVEEYADVVDLAGAALRVRG